VLEGDIIEITIDRNNLTGTVNIEGGEELLAKRGMRPDLAADPQLPADSRLWAILQNVSGGTWGGCVYDLDAIAKALK
jgi:dihydroxyacid dehydratase/phosphogluconate dehydratase